MPLFMIKYYQFLGYYRIKPIRISQIQNSIRSKFDDSRYRILILLILLYGCENWSLTFREEHRLRVFENRVLRRIFAPKIDARTGKWRKILQNKINQNFANTELYS